jgi:micrococcal nuclease
MKKLLFVFLLCISCVVNAETLYSWTVNKVIDGDTISFKVQFLPAPLKPVISVRVDGVDTPEKGFRAKCDKEKVLALKASEFTQNLISNSRDIKVKLLAWDKYGGRVLGDVIVDGKSLSSLLISGGFAREYHGEAKQSWCE